MLGGVQYSNALSRWLAYKPSDPANQLAASWHVYNFNVCNNQTCWESTAGRVMQQNPVIAGEIGENDCGHSFIDSLMSWMDGKNELAAHSGPAHYVGWTWNTWDCSSGPALITNYSGTPTQTFGQGYHDHLAALPTP
jgi:endoglucanase